MRALFRKPPPSWALVLVSYLLATFLIAGPHLWPLFKVSDATFDAGDAHVSLWSLWWTRRAVESLSNPFWTDHLFFPRGTSLAFHSYPFVYGLLSLPIQYAVAGKEGLALAFNGLLLLSFVASAAATYALVVRVTGHRPAAWIAGLAYAFAPFHLLNSCRLAVAAIEVLPLYLLALLRLQERPTWPRALAVSVCLAVAYYNGSEYALYLALASLLWGALGLISRDPRFDRALWRHLGGAAAAFLLLTAPLWIQQVRVLTTDAPQIGGKWDEAVRWSPALLSFVTPSRAHPLLGPLWAFAGEHGDGATLGMRSETAIGVCTTLLALVALARWRRDGRALFGAGALFFLVLSLGPRLRVTGRWETSIPLPYAALYRLLPPLRAVKEPARLFPLVMLMLVVLAAFALRDLASSPRAKPWQRRGLLLVSASAVLFEALTAWPGQTVRHRSVAVEVPFYRTLAQDRDDVTIMNIAAPGDPLATAIAQPLHGKKTTEWQGFIPRTAAIEADGPLLELERVLKHPRLLLERSGVERRRAVDRYRRALEEARTRYILWPESAAEGAQGAWVRLMASLLGGALRLEGGLLVLEMPVIPRAPGGDRPED